jgi:hypothetical protein
LKASSTHYSPRQASYNLKKLRARNLVRWIPKSRRYETVPEGLRAMVAFLVLMDTHYQAITEQIRDLFQFIGIAA